LGYDSQYVEDSMMAKAPALRVNAPPSIVRPPAKAFTVAPWIGSNEGEKVLIYSPSGMGKTTLAAMAPDPVFIGVDDGGRKIVNPKTGQPVLHVSGVTEFEDVRTVLQSDVFDGHASIVIDTVTEVQERALRYMYRTIKGPQGITAANIEDYGWSKGYRYLRDTMHLLLPELDSWVRKGKNIILLCQSATMKERTEGADYLKDGPDLSHNGMGSVRNDYIAWVDHVFRINWESASVKDRKISPVQGRVIQTQPDASFHAKSRGTTFTEAPVVSFERPDDDSLWTFLFGGK
jgi:hypothetical protein